MKILIITTVYKIKPVVKKESLGEADKLERGGYERENIVGVICRQELKE
jgi:hypothetical protein